jgi:hypothetical protein
MSAEAPRKVTTQEIEDEVVTDEEDDSGPPEPINTIPSPIRVEVKGQYS